MERDVAPVTLHPSVEVDPAVMFAGVAVKEAIVGVAGGGELVLPESVLPPHAMTKMLPITVAMTLRNVRIRFTDTLLDLHLDGAL
jgi:hypothetical protein